MFRKGMASIALRSDPSVRRSHISPDELVAYPAGDDIRVVSDIFAYTAKKYGDKVACSYRDIINVVEEVKNAPKGDGSGDETKAWK